MDSEVPRSSSSRFAGPGVTSASVQLLRAAVLLDLPQRPDRGTAGGRVRLLVAGDPLKDLDLLGFVKFWLLWFFIVFFAGNYPAVF